MRQAWQAQWANMSPSERRLLTVAAWLAGLTLVVMVGVLLVSYVKLFQDSSRRLTTSLEQVEKAGERTGG